jgi:hypothetical protein
MHAAVKISLLVFATLVYLLGWLLALGGTAALQSTGEIYPAKIGFSWWVIWFHFFVNLPLAILVFISSKTNALWKVSKMFVFLLGILSTLCMIVTDTIVSELMMGHDSHDSKCVSALRASTGGFVLLTFQNLISGCLLTTLEDKYGRGSDKGSDTSFDTSSTTLVSSSTTV